MKPITLIYLFVDMGANRFLLNLTAVLFLFSFCYESYNECARNCFFVRWESEDAILDITKQQCNIIPPIGEKCLRTPDASTINPKHR